MRTIRLGSLEVSVIGLGCNNFGRALDPPGSAAVVDAALKELDRITGASHKT